MRSRPKLGQHFLRDQDTLARIAEAAASPGDTAIEIGPGRGALTRHLLARAARVVAVELDGTLAAQLPQRCGHRPHLEVVQEDFLRCDLEALALPAGREHCVLTGNIPYYITSPILRAIFRAGPSFRSATLLMQEEVADRAVARPGSRAYGFLSCLCQLHSAARKLFSVPPAAFSPAPKVRSALVKFDLRERMPPSGLVRFLGACFRFRRKTLKNNLLASYPRAQLAADRCAGMRAQQLDIGELTAMWQRLESVQESD